MKAIVLAVLLVLQTFSLTPAFQSIVSPSFSAPFSSYSFNVINPSGSQNRPSQIYTSPYTGYRVVYVPPPTVTSQQYGIFQYLGQKAAPSIVKLKNFVRKSDGSQNNVIFLNYNQAKTGLARHTTALYKDGQGTPITSDFAPRMVSNALGIPKLPLRRNPNNVTMAFVIWGQFMDHDIDLTEVGSDEMPVYIPKCDPYMDVECTGGKTIPFKRSLFMSNTTVRDQMNSITGWVDGSQVYGSSQEVSKRLRTLTNGLLKQGEHMMLPLDPGNQFGLNDAGDSRANENLLLTSYHTIFVREHNRIAKFIASQDATLRDEDIYQAARNYVTALIQKITYEDFLPILLGEKAYAEYVGPYPGYDPNVDPTVEIEFTTAAFRFAHSMLMPVYPLINRYGEVEEQITLNDMFFRPDKLDSTYMEKLLRGLSRTVAKLRDGTLIDEVRNLLITDPAKRHINMDLYSLNVQRARDHGLEKFNYLRMSYGFPPLASFLELTGDEDRAQLMENFYKNINEIDPWVGILNEKSTEGGAVGEVAAKIIGTTFNKLRNGDRFWYEQALPMDIVKEIKETSFSEVIIRNTGILELQEDIFHYSYP